MNDVDKGWTAVATIEQTTTPLRRAGAILFDPGLSPQVGENWFDPAYWQGQGALRVQGGGRGGVALIDTPAGPAVLKHYRRGGAMARLLGDRYLWQGAAASRGFAELELLAWIGACGLPGPRGLAARYQRHGMFYRADLITVLIPAATTLAEQLAAGRLEATLAKAVGELVARFHAAGIWHADLNAHNVLINAQGLHLIDFDRGRRRPIEAGWRLANLARLRRSLLKLGAAAKGEAMFEQAIWQPLLAAYHARFAA